MLHFIALFFLSFFIFPPFLLFVSYPSLASSTDVNLCFTLPGKPFLAPDLVVIPDVPSYNCLYHHSNLRQSDPRERKPGKILDLLYNPMVCLTDKTTL